MKVVTHILAVSTLLLIFQSVLYSQSKRGNQWILGQTGVSGNAGVKIDFNGDSTAVSFFSKQLQMFHATTSTLCDANGDLLLYSNGCEIVDSENNFVTNSENMTLGIERLSSCTLGSLIKQTAIMLPLPCYEEQVYYIGLDLDDVEIVAKNLYASLIDISNSGNYEVVDKHRSILQDTLAAKNLVATRHGNGRDWWISIAESRPSGSNCYYSVLLNENGFQQPVKSCSGPVVPGTVDGRTANDIGDACFSIDGSIYARVPVTHDINIYDFDNSTGVFSIRETIPFPYNNHTSSTGVSISPNNRFLYVSAREKLFQFDLESDTIAESKTLVATWDGTQDPQATIFHTSRLAPDGKIYISSISTTSSLHVIHRPNEKGLACDVEQRGLQFPEFNGDILWNGSAIPSNPLFGTEPDNSVCDSLLMISNTYVPSASQHLSFSLYPNPVLDIVTIKLDHKSKIKSLSILDPNGKTVFVRKYSYLNTDSLQQSTFDLPSGLYTILISTELGEGYSKFVKL